MFGKRWPFLLGLVLTIAACSSPERQSQPATHEMTPMFELSARRDSDSADVLIERGRVVLVFHSPTGISEATITRKAADWPESCVLRLQLAGLEHFSLSGGDIKIEGAVSSQDGSVRVWLAGREEHPLRKSDPLWVDVRRLDAAGEPTTALDCPDGSIELAVPRAFLEDNPRSVTLGWVDFYRG